MSTRTWAVLAGVVGSAMGAWWWVRKTADNAHYAARERGTVIFDNTPTA